MHNQNPSSAIKKFLPIFIFISALIFYRWGLLDRGFLFNPDEYRYFSSLRFLLNLKNEGFLSALNELFIADARPGFILLGIIPAIFQLASASSHVAPAYIPDTYSTLHPPEFYNPVIIFNIIISALTALLFYLISLKLLKKDLLALCATITWSLLCNTNVYIRHLVPYDWSLLFFFLALYITISKTPFLTLNQTAFLSGGLNAFAVTIYPGFYMFYVINAILTYLSADKNEKLLVYFLIPLAIWLAILEAASHLVGNSQILSSLTLSDTVIYGSFSESLIFLPKYLFSVEGYIGFLLFFLFLIFLLRKKKEYLHNSHIIWTATICYFIHGMAGFAFHKYVFYGRILHMYLPFVVLGAFLTIRVIKNEKFQLFLTLFISTVSLISFVQFSNEYSKVLYPDDIRQLFFKNIPRKEIFITDENNPQPISKENFQLAGVNLNSTLTITDEYYPETFWKSMKLVFSWPHPITFSAYTFEGLSIEQRKKVRERNYQMKIYTRKR